MSTTRIARIVRRSLIGLVVLYAGVLLLVNAILMTSLGPGFASSETTKVRWSSGYSLLPTRIHLRGLAIDVHGKATDWQVRSARADARLGILALCRGELDVHSAELTHVTLRGDDAAATDETTRAPTAPVTIHELVANDVSEIAIASTRWLGSATARGSLEVDRDGTAHVRHAAARFEGGELFVGEQKVLHDVRGDLVLAAQTVTVDEPAWQTWFGATAGGLELTADVVAPPFLRSGQPSGGGKLRTSIRIEDGALAPNTTASIHVPTIPVAGTEAAAPFALDAVLGVADDRRVTLKLDARAGEVPLFGDGATASVDTLHAELFSPRMTMRDPLRGVGGTVRAAGARVDARSVPIVRQLVRERGSEATLSADADLVLTDGALSGKIAAAAPSIELGVGDVSLPGRLRADVVLRAWHLGSHEAQLEGSFVHGAETTPPAASLSLTDARMRFDRGRPPSLDGRARFAMRDARAALDALTGAGPLPRAVAAIASTQPIDGTMQVSIRERQLVLGDIHASAGIVRVRGEYVRAEGGPASATLLVEAGPLATGVSVDGERTTLVVVDARTWFEDALARRSPDRLTSSPFR